MLSVKKLLYKILTFLNTSKSGTFTRAQSGSIQSIHVRQHGKVVSIMGFITGVNISTSSSGTGIGTLSNVSLPPTPLRFLCMVGANAYSQGTPSYCYIGTDGGILVTSSNTGSNKAVYFNVTYIAD